MEFKKLLFLIFIPFSFQFKNQGILRQLEPVGDTNSELDSTEIVPSTNSQDIPNHSYNETNTDESTNAELDSTEIVPSTNSQDIPNHSYNETNTITIPSVISSQSYSPTVEKSLLVLIAIGNFVIQPINTPKREVAFVVFYKVIIGTYILPYRMTVKVKITYNNRLLRYLEEKEEVAECIRYTNDTATDIKYNCTFQVRNNSIIEKVTSDGEFKFDGMDESIAPIITMSSLVNETMRQNGIQNAQEDLEKTQFFLLNNTILEENGLRFKLMGEMIDNNFPEDQKVVLMFDEKGDGKIKNATCNVNKIEGKIYELDCLAEKSINAHLNGVNGITNSQNPSKLIIYMKPNGDEILNTGSNNMGLYNRGSSSGLSGGAIAGIVIACIIALICITIGVMICRKTSIGTSLQESSLGVNSNNIPVQESSFGVYNSSTLNNIPSQYPESVIEAN